MSSKSLSSLFYDFDNVGEFGSLFEHEKMLADFVLGDTYGSGNQQAYLGAPQQPIAPSEIADASAVSRSRLRRASYDLRWM